VAEANALVSEQLIAEAIGPAMMLDGRHIDQELRVDGSPWLCS
jgi:hypothetical protein